MYLPGAGGGGVGGKGNAWINTGRSHVTLPIVFLLFFFEPTKMAVSYPVNLETAVCLQERAEPENEGSATTRSNVGDCPNTVCSRTNQKQTVCALVPCIQSSKPGKPIHSIKC